MRTVNFEQANGALESGDGGKIPIHFDKETKIVTTCWELSDAEMLEFLKNKKIYISAIVKDGKELQPTMPLVKFG